MYFERVKRWLREEVKMPEQMPEETRTLYLRSGTAKTEESTWVLKGLLHLLAVDTLLAMRQLAFLAFAQVGSVAVDKSVYWEVMSFEYDSSLLALAGEMPGRSNHAAGRRNVPEGPPIFRQYTREPPGPEHTHTAPRRFKRSADAPRSTSRSNRSATRSTASRADGSSTGQMHGNGMNGPLENIATRRLVGGRSNRTKTTVPPATKSVKHVHFAEGAELATIIDVPRSTAGRIRSKGVRSIEDIRPFRRALPWEVPAEEARAKQERAERREARERLKWIRSWRGSEVWKGAIRFYEKRDYVRDKGEGWPGAFWRREAAMQPYWQELRALWRKLELYSRRPKR